MDGRSEELLSTYRKQVRQLARQSYLQVKAAVRELNESKVNPEDIVEIKLHMIAMIANTHNLEGSGGV
jgi:mRNA-degrading endonuclease RelE of RelBE toxin-antitoxin system